MTADVQRRPAHQAEREAELAAILPLVDAEILSAAVPVLAESPS